MGAAHREAEALSETDRPERTMKSIILIGSALIFVSACKPSSKEITLDPSTLGEPGFVMSDNLMGTLIKSSSHDQIGDKVTFVGLNSNQPKVVFESGTTSPLQKIYESERTLTLILVALGSGSIDSFVIDKKTGKFARVTAGNVYGVYATAAVGTIK